MTTRKGALKKEIIMAKKIIEDEIDEEEDDLDEEDDDTEDEEARHSDSRRHNGSDEEDNDESEEEDSEEDSEEDDQKEDKEDALKYSAKHLTKIISAKHNKMKNQFTKKLEESQTQTAVELDAANAIVGWLSTQSSMTKEQILAKIGYIPVNRKVTVDSKLFDSISNGEIDDNIQAQINKLESKVANYPGWKANKKMVIEYAQDTGLSVDKAYWALLGAKAASAAKKQGADEVLTRRSNKAAKVTEGSGSAVKNKSYSRQDKENAAAVGMDVAEYVKYQGIEDYDAYQKSKQKKRR